MKQKQNNFSNKISTFYDGIAKTRKKWIEKGSSFHMEDRLNLKELILPKSRILELGCGTGYLLKSLDPSYGVGIDLSKEMIKEANRDNKGINFIQGNISNLDNHLSKKEKFDYIILSDTIGYIEDVQTTLESLHEFCNKETRIIISYYSPLWSPIFSLATLLKFKMPEINTQLLNLQDIKSFLKISNFDVVRIEKKILLPISLLGIGRIINRYLATLPLFSFFCLRQYVIARSLTKVNDHKYNSASIIIPCKNEQGNIENAIKRLPRFSKRMEVIFVEGNSSDKTWEKIQLVKRKYNRKGTDLSIKSFKQKGKGKAEAVFFGFEKASNEVLFILDADLTMPPEELPKFWQKIKYGEAEYVNGTRLIYPMDNDAMRFLNYLANKMFSILFSWILSQRYTDTLCGTKVITKENYTKIKIKNKDLGNFDPFGDFFIIFGSSRLCLKMCEIPIRYKARAYGETQISRFSHGFMLIKMVIFAFFKIKAI
ncbi:glycosyltransferase [Alphaproteobacteria bacterium]|nr:glycosyltransferase [Alphaproteobacteria bacterium]